MRTVSPYWNPKIETCSRDELRKLQGKKLRAAVERAYANSAFHKRMLDAKRVKLKRLRADDLATNSGRTGDEPATASPWYSICPARTLSDGIIANGSYFITLAASCFQ